MFDEQYRGTRVFLTGHTGFKGSWLAYWLTQLGANVTGYALAPDTQPNHWDLLKLDMTHHFGDVREYEQLKLALTASQPEIIFHLAAQPLVRKSYRDPLGTWSTNVMGTANILEACKNAPSVRSVVIITTDKCYENYECAQGYVETDRLGGHDPYSASKAATELVAASFREAFFNDRKILLATARAGNVIGGGDWSEDRLIPDLVRSIVAGKEMDVRAPLASRPWQHVLDSLSGYLLLGKYLLQGNELAAQAWNFGPERGSSASVQKVLTMMHQYWPSVAWHHRALGEFHETHYLGIDSQKVRNTLNWSSVWPLSQTTQRTAEWYRAFCEMGDVLTAQQWQNYVADARQQGVCWT